MSAGKLGRRRKSFSKSSLLRSGLRYGVDQLEARRMLAVDLDFVTSAGTWSQENGADIVTVDPGAVFVVTARVKSSDEGLTSFQLNFENSGLAGNGLELSTWTREFVWGLNFDGQLDTPHGDTFVSAASDFSGTPLASPVSLGNFILSAPTAPGDYLLTINSGGSGPFDTQFIGSSSADALPVVDYGDLIIRVQPPLPVLSLAAQNADQPEGNSGTTEFTFTASRTGDLSGASSAKWSVGSLGGIYGADELDFGGEFPSGTVNFAPGEAVQTITVPVRGDLIAEEDEHFYVIITNIQGGTFGSTQAQGNIRNDDQAVLLSVTHLQQLEGDEGSTELIFTVVLDAPADTELVIPFTTMDGTAIAGSDYNPVSGQLTFAPNEQVKTIAVSVLGDLEEEGHETFLLNVGGVAATGTILDDDGSLPYQTVRGKAASQTAIAGEYLSVPIQYDVSDGDDTLSGLGLRVHFDSSMLTFESVADVLSTNLFVTASVQLDFGDYDGNPDTDKFILISWADLFGGSWPGPGHPLPVDLLTANFTLAENLPAGAATQITFSSSSSAASHEFLGVPVDVKVTDVTIDIDSNGAADALSDGVIIVRHLFGASGNALVDGVLPGNSKRTDPAEITAYLERASLAGMLDVDGNGVSDALSDGIILVRYLFGATGTALVDGVLPGDAVRTDPQEISDFIAAFLPSPAPAITPLFDSGQVRAENGERSLADSILLRMIGLETQSCLVSSEADLHLQQLWENSPQLFDVDGDGEISALTDGTLISRHFAGAKGDVLVAGAIAPAATRTGAEEIRAYLDQLFLPSRETRSDSLQIVTPTPQTQTAQAGQAVSFDVMYTTEPEDNTLTGLGLRLHFDSSKLQFSDASNRLSPTFLPPTLMPDEADLDGDPSTDMYVSVAWADFGGNWPSTSLPTRLYTANFVTLGDFSGETTLNFTDSSTAANFDLMATSAVIKAAQPVDLSISAPQATAEGNSETTSFEFQVKLAENPELAVTVDLSTFDLTAIAGEGDYTPLTTTLTFQPGGPLVQTVTVEVAGDLRIEGDETFELKVTGSSGPVNVVQGTAVATILNDDLAEIEFVAENETIDEADTVYNLLVRLDTGGHALETDVRVDLLDLFDGASTSGNDYAELGAQTITFPAGSADGATLSFPITILDDNLVEGDETASFGLTGVVGPANLGSRDTHLLTLRDDEQAQVQFLLATSEVVEGDTDHEIAIRLATDGVLAYPVTVDVVDLLTGTATRGLDYTHFSSHAITFDVGAADGATQSATLSILDDGLLEAGESVALGLEALSGPATLSGKTSHLVTILDNEVAIEFSLSGDAEVVEGEAATYTVSYVGTLPAGTTASIDVSLIDIETTPADRSDLLAALSEAVALTDGITLSDNTITFAAGGDTSLTFSIEAIDDAVPSLNSNFQLTLSSPGASGNVVSSISQSEVTTTLRDDEPVADVLLTVVDLNGTPGLVVGEQFEINVHFRDLVHLQAVFAGYTDIQFAPTLLRVDGIRFTDDYPFGRTGTIDNVQGLVDEVGATDGMLPSGDTVVFTLEMTALAADVTTITSDVADAGLSEIVLFGDDADYRQNTQFGSLELEIEQATLISFEQATTQVGEDNTTLDIYVRLSTGGPALLEEVSVDVVDALSGSASSGLDYSQFAAQTVNFPAGSADGATQKISLEIRNDLLVESKEEIHLALANLTGQAEFGLINQHVVTIIDDEAAEVVFDTASSMTNEADAEHGVVIRLNTGGGTLAEEVTVGIQDLLSGSALSGVDYAALAGASVTFAAGSVDGATQSLFLAPLNDDLVEGDENLELALVNVLGPASLGTRTQHSVTMTDDDFAVVTFEMPSSDAAEDGGVHNVVVRLDTGGATLAKAISVDLLDLASGSASSQLDYAEVGTHTLTFGAGSVDGATQTFALDILDDNLIEGNETIYLALANPTGPAGLGPDTVQEINLIDTEPDLVAVGFDALSDHILLGRTDLTITIANQGNGAAGAFEFDLIWSDDAVLGNEDDIVVTTITVPAGIAANDSVELTLNDVQLDRSILFARALRDDPAGKAVGTLSTESDLLAIAIDPRHALNELNEDNNTDRGLGVDADFVSYFPWDIDGSGQVTPTDAAYVVNRLEGSDPLADLDGDGTVSQAEGQAVLERIGYLRNLADPFVGSGNTYDLIGSTAPTGEPLPNLLGTSFEVVQTSLNAGDTFDVELTVTNDGSVGASNIQVSIYVSPDPTFTTQDAFVVTDYISSLAAGASTNLSLSGLSLRPPGDHSWTGNGDYYIGMMIDSLNQIPEYDETDNSGLGNLIDYEIVPIGNAEAPGADVRVFAVDRDGGTIVEIDGVTGDVINHFPVPGGMVGSGADGLAFNGTSLFYAGAPNFGGGGILYELNADTGQVIDSDSFASLGLSGAIDGLGFFQGEVIASDTSSGQLFFINPTIDQITNIVLQASLPAGGLTGAESRGTVFAGNFNFGEIYEIDPEFGTVINTISAPTSDILGLAFIDGILLAGDAASGTIYLMNPDTGNVLHAAATSLSISALAGGISSPGGVDGISGRIWEDANGDGIQNTGEAGMPGVVVYVDQNQNGQFDDGELTAVTSNDNPDTPGNDEGGYYAFSNLAPGTYTIRELVPNGYQLTYPTGPGESSLPGRPAIDLLQEYQVGERVRPLGYLGDVQPNIVTVDNPANHEVSPGGGYDGVVRLYIERFDLGGFVTCSGTLLEGGTHILTAAHCLADDWGDAQAGIVDVQFDLPGGTQFIPASTVTVHAQYDGFELNNDIAIVQLSQVAPAEAERYGIFRGTTEIGSVGTKVGYGRSGTGDVGDVIASGTKRLAHNTYEGFGEIFNPIFGFGNLPETQLAFDFDNGIPANDAFGVVFGTHHVGLGTDEGNSASGDSGGPTFFNVAGELLIAGVTSYGFGFDGAPDVTPGTDSSFGEFSVDTRVSAYADWIDNIVGTTTGGSTKTPGNGFWTVVLEAGDAVNDVNFGNRQLGMLPDLIGTAFDVEATDDTVMPGSSVTFSFSFQNIGGVAINDSYDVGFYLSTDPHISTSDTLIGFIVGGPLLQAGGVHNGVFTAPIPQSLTPGDYYIGMIVDDLNYLVEANETNNANRGLGIDIDDITIEMPPGNLEGSIWIDVNGNGTRDAGEPGHAGVTVFLDLNNNGVLDSGEPTTITSTDDVGTTTVDEAGRYAFSDLPPGSYTVSELVPAGFAQTFPTPPTSEFDLEVNFTDDSLTPSQQAIFSLAAARWAEIIIGDLPDVNIAGFGLVDDLVIDASAPHIDGPGGVLGQAGPTVVRTGSFLPARGTMQFDAADLAHLEATGQLMDVILHEMGHVIGIGTIWQDLGLLVGAGSTDPRFTGTNATTQYNTIFGLSGTSVPVANTGGAGTRDAHWREADLHNELMTGFLNSGIVNPLSRITVGSLADLGYVVDLDAADDYSPPGIQALARRAVEGELLALDLPKQLVTPLEPASGLRQPQLEVGAESHQVYLSPGETISGLDFGNQPLANAPLLVVGVDINEGLSDPSDLSKGGQPTSWEVQRSQLVTIRVTFSDDIISLSANDLVLRNLGVQADIDPDTEIVLQDSQLTVSGNSLTIDLTDLPLLDGVYELELLPSIQSQSGDPLDGDGDGVGGDAFLLSGSAANGLFQLQADFNGDGTVSQADYPTFEYWFGTSVPAAPAYVDLNSDGGVSAPDFFTFQQNFGTTSGLVFPTVQFGAARTDMAVRLDPADPVSRPLETRPLQYLGADVLSVIAQHLPPRDTQNTADAPLIAEDAVDTYFGDSTNAFGNLELLENVDAFDLWELSEDSRADQDSVSPTLEDLV